MLNRHGSGTGGAPGAVEEDPAPGAFNSDVDFNRLSENQRARVIALYRRMGDEIERTIGLCEAPWVLWHPDTASAREPEPFGMIA
jgi:hypothetical protein